MTTTEIQQQIDAAHAAGGGEVVLPAGTHRLDAALRLKPRVTLRGEGASTRLATQDKETNFIELHPGGDATAHDITIRALHLQGPDAGDDITVGVASDFDRGCGVIARKAPAHIRIADVTIAEASGCGLLFLDRSADGVGRHIRIARCRIRQGRRPADAVAFSNYKDIYFFGAFFEDIEVVDTTCTFEPNAVSVFGNDSGIAFVMNGHEGAVRRAVLKGNVCSGHARHGIVTNYGKLVAFDVKARGNTCRDNRWVGLYVNTSIEQGENVVIEENVCEHNGYGGTSDPNAPDKTIRGGIVLAGCYNARISNNQCRHNGRPSPPFAGADATAQFAAGIRVRGRNLVLVGNKAEHNVGRGIEPWPEPFENVEIRNGGAGDGEEGDVSVRTTETPPPIGTPPPMEPPSPPDPPPKRKKKKSLFKRLFGWLFG